MIVVVVEAVVVCKSSMVGLVVLRFVFGVVSGGEVHVLAVWGRGSVVVVAAAALLLSCVVWLRLVQGS